MHPRHVFTFHPSVAGLIDHFDASYSRSVEHAAVVVSLVHERPRAVIGYWVLDVRNRSPNRSRRGAQEFAVSRTETEERIASLFVGGVPPRGVTAGLVAVLHTHPDDADPMPSAADLDGTAPYTLGAVCHLGRRVTRWYDRRGIVARPAAITPHPSWQLPLKRAGSTRSVPYDHDQTLPVAQ